MEWQQTTVPKAKNIILKEFLKNLEWYQLVNLQELELDVWKKVYKIIHELLNQDPPLETLKDVDCFRNFKKFFDQCTKYFLAKGESIADIHVK